mgnify:CR=1 FL=1
MKLAAGLLLVAVIAGQGVDGKRQLRGERGRHLITLKQAMGVGKKFQERWNNGYLYDDDADDLGFTWDDYINSPSTGPIRVRQRDEEDDLGLTLKQAMGVGKKFQERWNNGYLYDDDADDLGFTWDDYINSPSTGPIRVRQRDEEDDLGLTLKQAMGVGKKFQERWNNGYLYDDDDNNFPNLARRRTMTASFCKYCLVHGKFSEIQCNAWCR